MRLKTDMIVTKSQSGDSELRTTANIKFKVKITAMKLQYLTPMQ